MHQLCLHQIEIVMEATKTIFNVESILFEGNDADVLMKGTTIKGVMQYESDWIISQTQLNMVLNMLQRQNTDLSIHECIKSEPMYNGDTLFSGNFRGLTNVTIDINSISMSIPMKQIRA